MSLTVESLPYVDQHSLTIEAGREASWDSLQRVLEVTSSAVFARILGCADAATSGPRPFAEGSAVPGFHVAAAEGPVELTLAEGH